MSVLLDKKGFTLVEMMVALVVLLLVFLALMQTALVSINSNMKNPLRDEAVSVAETRMSETRNFSFTQTADNLTASSDTAALAGADCPEGFPAAGVLIERNVRNITGVDFCTNRTVTSLGDNTRRVDIMVGWKWKGEDYTHNISTLIRRQ